jgi:hypothetical protein
MVVSVTIIAQLSSVRRFSGALPQLRREISIKGWNIDLGSLNRVRHGLEPQTWLI